MLFCWLADLDDLQGGVLAGGACGEVGEELDDVVSQEGEEDGGGDGVIVVGLGAGGGDGDGAVDGDPESGRVGGVREGGGGGVADFEDAVAQDLQAFGDEFDIVEGAGDGERDGAGIGKRGLGVGIAVCDIQRASRSGRALWAAWAGESVGTRRTLLAARTGESVSARRTLLAAWAGESLRSRRTLSARGACGSGRALFAPWAWRPGWAGVVVRVVVRVVVWVVMRG